MKSHESRGINMVTAITHFAAGILIAWVFGFKGKKKWGIGILAALPDIDMVTDLLFKIIDNGFYLEHDTRNLLYYILGHRELLHSWLAIIIMTVIIAIWKKDRRYTFAGFLALFSHFLLDFGTTWMTRPFWPFNDYFATLGVMDWLDPVTTLVSFIVLYLFFVEKVAEREKWKGKFLRTQAFLRKRGKRAARITFVILCSYCLAVTPAAKLILVATMVDEPGGISYKTYKNAHPYFFGTYVGAYEHNDTHFYAFKISWWSGMVKSKYVQKVTSEDDISNGSYYIDRARELYDGKVPEEIVYFTYSLTGNSTHVNVTISDARNSVVNFRAMFFFGPIYTFSFDKQTDVFSGYIDQPYKGGVDKADNNWFE